MSFFVRRSLVQRLGAGALALSTGVACAEPDNQPRTAPPLAESAAIKTAPDSAAAPSIAVAKSPGRPAVPVVTLRANADLTRQTLTVIEHGRTIATWSISSGVEDHATPRGLFQPEWTAKMWYSRTYDNAPMPNAVFFKDGAAIHATQSTGALGRAASHGCVRLTPAHAETFYKLVQKHGLAHTRINVFGTPRFEVQVASARVGQRNRNLDAWGDPAPRRTYPDNAFAPTLYARIPLSAVRYR